MGRRLSLGTGMLLLPPKGIHSPAAPKPTPCQRPALVWSGDGDERVAWQLQRKDVSRSPAARSSPVVLLWGLQRGNSSASSWMFLWLLYTATLLILCWELPGLLCPSLLRICLCTEVLQPPPQRQQLKGPSESPGWG